LPFLNVTLIDHIMKTELVTTLKRQTTKISLNYMTRKNPRTDY